MHSFDSLVINFSLIKSDFDLKDKEGQPKKFKDVKLQDLDENSAQTLEELKLRRIKSIKCW